jgi:uncharacterized membrane protein
LLPIVSSGMLYLVSAIEIIAALLIGLASLQCAVTVAGLFFRHSPSTTEKEDVRLQFGLWLSLAIEFELAADILRTTIAPSWEEIGKLAAIVVLRTVLNYFLQTEIRRAAQQKTNTAG